jgi:hypothetical protein
MPSQRKVEPVLTGPVTLGLPRPKHVARILRLIYPYTEGRDLALAKCPDISNSGCECQDSRVWPISQTSDDRAR